MARVFSFARDCYCDVGGVRTLIKGGSLVKLGALSAEQDAAAFTRNDSGTRVPAATFVSVDSHQLAGLIHAGFLREITWPPAGS